MNIQTRAAEHHDELVLADRDADLALVAERMSTAASDALGDRHGAGGVRREQTQTEHKPARDAEMERLRAQVAYLKHALAYSDTESMRKRAESVASEELLHCQRRVVQLQGYNQKLARLTEMLSKRLGLPTHRAGPPRAAQATKPPTPSTATAESNIERA